MNFSYKNLFAAVLLTLLGTASQATTWTINVQSNSFVNNPTSVNVGDTIVWVWVSGTHNTTSMSVPAGAAPWASPINSGSTTYQYVITVAGEYTYECTFHPSQMSESFDALGAPCTFIPTITPTNPNLCPNSTDTLWASPDSAVYQWFKGGALLPGETNQFLVITTADNGFAFDVEITLDGCTDESEEVVVDTMDFDAAELIASINSWLVDGTYNVCAGETIVVSLVSDYDTNFQWFNAAGPITGATNDSLSVTETGFYSVTYAPAVCPDYTQTITLNADINLPLITVVDQIDDSTLQASPSDLTYQWFFNGNIIVGATNESYNPNETGIYTVIGTSVNGCTATSDPFVFVATGCNFVPEVSPNNLILCPNSNDTLIALPSGGTYQWYQQGVAIPGATNSFYAVNAFDNAGYQYSVAITLDGCTDTSAQVLVDGWVFLPPAVMQSENGWVDVDGTHICAGDTLILTLLSPYTTNIQWYNNGDPIPGETNSVFNAISPGNYTVSGAPEQCPNYVQNVGVTISVLVEVPIVPVLVLSNDTIFANPMTGPYEWFFNGNTIPGETNYWIIPANAGLYNAVLSSPNQCSAISGPIAYGLVDTCAWEPAISPGNLTLCPNSSDTLFVSPVGAGYQWYQNGLPVGGAMNQYLIVNNLDAGSQFSAIIVLDGCIDTTLVMTVNEVTFNPPSVTASQTGWIDVNGAMNYCDGDVVTLSLLAPYNTNIQWFNNGNEIPGATNSTLTVTDDGTYLVNGAPAQCPNYIQTLSEPIAIIFHEPTTPVITFSDDTLFANPAADTGYQWYLNGNLIAGATNDWYVPTGEGSYTVALNDANQCTDTSAAYIITGIAGVSATDLNIYPNPVIDELTIDYSGNNTLQYTIHDVTGRIVVQGECNRMIHTNQLAAGTYLLYVIDKQKAMKQVFVKE